MVTIKIIPNAWVSFCLLDKHGVLISGVAKRGSIQHNSELVSYANIPLFLFNLPMRYRWIQRTLSKLTQLASILQSINQILLLYLLYILMVLIHDYP